MQKTRENRKAHVKNAKRRRKMQSAREKCKAQAKIAENIK
jgi:hypothetical protein